MTGDRRRARRGEGERLRDEILQAAERLLVDTGDEDAVSIRAVADAVGVSPPAIYLHFEDKGDLLLAVCERHFVTLDEVTQAASAAVDDPVEALHRQGRAYIAFGLENPEHYRLLFMTRPSSAPSRRTTERLLEAGCFARVVQTVEACMAAGAFRPDDPVTVAVGLWATVHGITSLAITVPELPRDRFDDLVDHTLRAHLAGLAATAAPATPTAT